MPRAAIDIGSNSLLLTIQDDQGQIVHDEATVVGLGKGLGDLGAFRDDRMAAASEVLTRYARLGRAAGVHPGEVLAVATSAARRASNAGAFFDRVESECGIRVKVIAGEEEARLTFLGAALGLDLPPGLVGVVDLGGGSTELAVGEGQHIHERVSLEIGTVRLIDAFLGSAYLEGVQAQPDPAGLRSLRRHVDEVVVESTSLSPSTLVGVAGTATTLAAMQLDLDAYEANKVHGFELTRAMCEEWITRLQTCSLEQRAHWVRASPKRGPNMLAGACVLEAVMRHLELDVLVVSDGGLRHGLLQG